MKGVCKIPLPSPAHWKIVVEPNGMEFSILWVNIFVYSKRRLDAIENAACISRAPQIRRRVEDPVLCWGICCIIAEHIIYMKNALFWCARSSRHTTEPLAYIAAQATTTARPHFRVDRCLYIINTVWGFAKPEGFRFSVSESAGLFMSVAVYWPGGVVWNSDVFGTQWSSLNNVE